MLIFNKKSIWALLVFVVRGLAESLCACIKSFLGKRDDEKGQQCPKQFLGSYVINRVHGNSNPNKEKKNDCAPPT